MAEDNPILWTPSAERAEASSMARFIRWLKAERGLDFADYHALWDWSVSDLDGFWTAIIAFFDLPVSGWSEVLPERKMPGADWFPGATTNFAAQVLRHAETKPDAVAVVLQSETFGRQELTWAELAARVGAMQAALRRMGVTRGDRVVAILPNAPEALVAFLATVGMGAVWSLCAPDMGHSAILDRFRQIEPKVLIAQDGYVHAGKQIDKRPLIQELAGELTSLQAKVMVEALAPAPAGWQGWAAATAEPAAPQIESVAFSHPIWIVYSSGTTGNPKPIVHGHGARAARGRQAEPASGPRPRGSLLLDDLVGLDHVEFAMDGAVSGGHRGALRRRAEPPRPAGSLAHGRARASDLFRRRRGLLWAAKRPVCGRGQNWTSRRSDLWARPARRSAKRDTTGSTAR
ncbi:MAG: AMP-binding protein [Paracoccaceae bacterium]